MATLETSKQSVSIVARCDRIRGAHERRQSERTYVLDTSVLLSDPRAFFRFAEHAVVLPVVVITELEAKRHDPEIGYFARQALRNLDELRVEHERLDFPIPVGERRLAAGRAQPLEPVGAAVRPAARRQRLPHPRRAR